MAQADALIVGRRGAGSKPCGDCFNVGRVQCVSSHRHEVLKFCPAASGAAYEKIELYFKILAILAVDLRELGATGLGAMTAKAGSDVPLGNTDLRDFLAAPEDIRR